MNPFQALGIEPTQDKMKIRRAYVRETKLHHPDTGGNPDHFQTIQTAYNDLINNQVDMRELKVDVSLDIIDFLNGGVVETDVYKGWGEPKILQFDVPPHTYPDSVLTFYNIDSTYNKICVTLKEKRNSVFIRLEDRVVIRETINISEAILGKTLSVKNFDGNILDVNISPNTTADKLMFYFKGAGFFDKATKQRGDVTVVIEIDK